MADSATCIEVLHVDDEPGLADLSATFLERADDRLNVHTLTSANESLDFLSAHHVDCIISDYDMPAMNGIEFLESVRGDHPEVPFILFTGKGSEEIASDAISAGVSDYLQKESGTDHYVVLANIVTNLVSRSRAQADLETQIQQQQNAALRREHHREVLLELATDDAVASGEFETAVQRITETVADVLDLPRVNIWLIDDDDDSRILTCVEHYDRRTGEHADGLTLAIDEYPAYFEALETHRSIDAVDARRDLRTAELTENYLDVHDVGALLDATLRSEGETIGVICHEHIGGPREWTDDEIDFASDIADIVHRALRNQEQNEREQALEVTSQQFQAVLNTVEAAIFIKDTDGRYQLMNQECRRLFGVDPEEPITGRTDLDFFPEEVAAQYQADDQRVLQYEKSIEIEEEVPTPTGIQTNLTLKSPFYDEDGELQGICAVSKKIT